MVPVTPYTYRTYNSIGDIPMSRFEWDELVGRTPCAHVFVRHFWIHAWWQCFGGDYTLHFITAESDGNVVAFAPLMLDDKRVLRFVGDTNSDYLGFVIPKDPETILRGFFCEMFKRRGDWNVIHLKNLPAEHLSASELRNACEANALTCWKNYSEAAPYLPLKDKEREIQSLLNKYSMQRPVRSLSRLGEVRFNRQIPDSSLDNMLGVLAEQHIARSRKARRQSTFEDPRFVRFLKLLLSEDPDREHVRFSALLLDERPAACHFGFRSSDRLLWYKPSFDVSLSKSSPGLVLIGWLIKTASEESLLELDFTIGDEQFKQRFTDKSRKVNSFRIFPGHRLRFWIERGYWSIRHRLKSAMRYRPVSPPKQESSGH